jgi:hypothetical protein
MSSLKDYIEKDADLRERFVEEAFKQGGVADFPSFESALLNAFDTQRGRNASQKGFDDEDLKTLFESNECQGRMRQVLNEDEFNNAYAITSSQTVIKRTPQGDDNKIRPSDVMVITVPKKVEMSAYTRTINGKKVSVTAYKRSFKGWTDKEVRFLRVRKQQSVLSMRDIVYEYNNFFQGSERTESSIKTKIFRL